MQFHIEATMIRSRAVSLLHCPTCRYCPLRPDGAQSLILACQWLTLYVRGCASIWIGVFLGGWVCENVCYKVHLMSSCHMWSQNASFALLSNTQTCLFFLLQFAAPYFLCVLFCFIWTDPGSVHRNKVKGGRVSFLCWWQKISCDWKKSFQTDLSVIWFHCQSFLTPETRSSELVYYHFIRYGSNVVIDTSNPRSRSTLTYQAAHTHRIADPFTVAPFSRLMKTSQGLNTFDYLLWFLMNWFFY